MSESKNDPLRLGFDRQLKLEFHGFQLAEVAVPRQLFAAIVVRIGRLRLVCASG